MTTPKLADANRMLDSTAARNYVLENENECLRAALTEIAENPCLDPEGNAKIARRALSES